jgi:hypothetical protein
MEFREREVASWPRVKAERDAGIYSVDIVITDEHRQSYFKPMKASIQ